MNVWTDIHAGFIQPILFSHKLKLKKKKKNSTQAVFSMSLEKLHCFEKKNWLDFSQFLKHGYGKNKIVPIKTNCFQTALHCLAQIICPSIWKWGTMTD